MATPWSGCGTPVGPSRRRACSRWTGWGACSPPSPGPAGGYPHISVLLGPAAGGAACGSALSDVVLSAPEALMFVTGPAVVREVTGQEVSAADLGSPDVHAARSGLVHVEAESAGLALAVELNLVDEVIAPRRTRLSIAERLSELPARRGRRGNIPL